MSTCPCGSLVLPKDFTVTINGDTSVTCSFLHDNQDIYILSGQKFRTISETLSINNISSISIHSPSNIKLDNKIKITLKSYVLDKSLAVMYIGHLNNETNIQTINIYGDSVLSKLSLTNDRIILEIESVCEEVEISCCDKLPSSLVTSCLFDPCEICLQVITTTPGPTTTTTTTTFTTPFPPPTTTTTTTTSTTATPGLQAPLIGTSSRLTFTNYFTLFNPNEKTVFATVQLEIDGVWTTLDGANINPNDTWVTSIEHSYDHPIRARSIADGVVSNWSTENYYNTRSLNAPIIRLNQTYSFTELPDTTYLYIFNPNDHTVFVVVDVLSSDGSTWIPYRSFYLGPNSTDGGFTIAGFTPASEIFRARCGDSTSDSNSVSAWSTSTYLNPTNIVPPFIVGMTNNSLSIYNPNPIPCEFTVESKYSDLVNWFFYGGGNIGIKNNVSIYGSSTSDKTFRTRCGDQSYNSNSVSSWSDSINLPNSANLNPPLIGGFVNDGVLVGNSNDVSILAILEYSLDFAITWTPFNGITIDANSSNIIYRYGNIQSNYLGALFRARAIDWNYSNNASVSLWSYDTYTNTANLNAPVFGLVQYGNDANYINFRIFNPNDINVFAIIEYKNNDDPYSRWYNLWGNVVSANGDATVYPQRLISNLTLRTRCGDTTSSSNSVSKWSTETYFNTANISPPVLVKKNANNLELYNPNPNNLPIKFVVESSSNNGLSWTPYSDTFSQYTGQIFVYGSDTTGLLFRGRSADASANSNSVSPWETLV